ncbi:hypothetical protein FRC04_008660 [Tulasnella sp. 424]|nr:hypothetical protein FRC04_008660 [Tulasnella sp. 424]
MSQPVFGNYQGYYQKRPASCDPRLSLLRQSFFENKHVLDVGCNEGWVSIEIAQRWGAARVIGVDIDPELVAGAWKRRRTVWSVQSPPTKMSHSPDAPCPETHPFPIDYYPASLPYMYGPPESLSDQMDQTVPGGSDGVVSSNSLQSPVPWNGGDSYFPLSLVQSFGPMPWLPAEAKRETRFPHNVIFRTADWVEHGVPEDEGGYDVILA